MLFLIWLPGIVFLGVVGISCYRNKSQLFIIAQAVHNHFVFSERNREAVADDLLEVSPLDPQITKEGISSLVEYARQLNPDWIVAVNPGGRLVSTAVAIQMRIDPTQCLYVRCDPEFDAVTLAPGRVLPQFGGTILVVDDISRSGVTLELVKDYLMQINGTDRANARTVRFAVLVMDVSHNVHHVDFAPDWALYKTYDSEFKFVWTDFTDKIKLECKRKRAEREQQARAEGRHDVVDMPTAEELKLANNFEYAKSEVQKYLPRMAARF
jgi:hypoxanthine phosphoribosyltransferase